MVPNDSTTDRYQPALEAPRIAKAILAMFDTPIKSKDLANELDIHTSTASIMLQALKRDDLAEKDKWMYRLDKDELYGEFVIYLMHDIQESIGSYTTVLFEEYEDEIFANEDIRTHLMDYLKTELKFEEDKSVKDLFEKYRDDLTIRIHLQYILHAIDANNIPEEKQTFYRYVTALQGVLRRAAWTEPQHGSALANQLIPEEEYPDRSQQVQTLTDVEREVSETALDILEDMTDDDRLAELRLKALTKKPARLPLHLVKTLLTVIVKDDREVWGRDDLYDAYESHLKENVRLQTDENRQLRKARHHEIAFGRAIRRLARYRLIEDNRDTITLTGLPSKDKLRKELNIDPSESEE